MALKPKTTKTPSKLLDKDIREPLFIFLECEYGRMRIFEEKTIGKSRADVVMVLDDLLCGIEIKSDADSYARLKKQVRDYDKYYDINYAAVGASHGLHIEEHIPPYWGIIVFDLEDGKPDFYIQRRPQMNPKCKPLKKLEILWASELSHISVLNGMPKYTSKNKAFIREKLVEKVDPELLRRQVSEELFNRDYTLFNN